MERDGCMRSGTHGQHSPVGPAGMGAGGQREWIWGEDQDQRAHCNLEDMGETCAGHPPQQHSLQQQPVPRPSGQCNTTQRRQTPSTVLPKPSGAHTVPRTRPAVVGTAEPELLRPPLAAGMSTVRTARQYGNAKCTARGSAGAAAPDSLRLYTDLRGQEWVFWYKCDIMRKRVTLLYVTRMSVDVPALPPRLHCSLWLRPQQMRHSAWELLGAHGGEMVSKTSHYPLFLGRR